MQSTAGVAGLLPFELGCSCERKPIAITKCRKAGCKNGSRGMQHSSMFISLDLHSDQSHIDGLDRHTATVPSEGVWKAPAVHTVSN